MLLSDLVFVFFFFFFKQKTAYEMLRSLVGSEMCIRDRPRAADPTAPGTSRLCWHRYRRPPPTLRARPDRRSYALAAPGPPATVGTTDQVHPRRQPTTTCERGPGPRVRAPTYRLRR